MPPRAQIDAGGNMPAESGKWKTWIAAKPRTPSTYTHQIFLYIPSDGLLYLPTQICHDEAHVCFAPQKK